MYVYNYIHILWATRNDKGPPTNNYGMCRMSTTHSNILTFKLLKLRDIQVVR